MATVDTTTSEGRKSFEANKAMWIRKRISFATYPTTTSDTAYLLKVPKYTTVNTFQVTLVTAEGATATCDFGTLIGSTADDNGLDDSVDLNTTLGTLTRGAFGTDASIGLRFTDNGYITADPDHDLDTAVVDILVELVRDQDHD
jgi:hypothetical protein